MVQKPGMEAVVQLQTNLECVYQALAMTSCVVFLYLKRTVMAQAACNTGDLGKAARGKPQLINTMSMRIRGPPKR